MYSGMLLALMAFLVVPITPTSVWIAGAGLLLTLSLSTPSWYRTWSRGMRDTVRFSAGFFCAFAVLLTTSMHLLAGGVVAAGVGLCWLNYFRVRGGRKSSACNGCPELGCRDVCSGYQLQANLTRDFEEQATTLISRTMIKLPITRR